MIDYNEYRELTNLIEAYLDTGDRRTLAIIQSWIETKEDCRKILINDLTECSNNRYIKVFRTDDQVKILSDLGEKIRWDEYIAYKVSWMLPYVSDEALEQFLRKADDVELVRIMHEIKGNIRIIGNRICDSSTYFNNHTTNIFSRMRERMTWCRIYRKCRKNLKK